jgi:tetratricopeptide (TPR) repeat protein
MAKIGVMFIQLLGNYSMTNTTEGNYSSKELERLENDLLRATKWHAPCISLVLYDTAMNGSKAASVLEDRLMRKGQRTVHVAPNEKGQIELAAEFTNNKAWSETVFFVMHVSFNVEEAIYKTISDQSDFVINNRIRIVYWITEDDFATYISQMPERWIFEQRFYSLTQIISWKSIWSLIGTRTWSAAKKRRKELAIKEDTHFEEILSLDIRDDFEGLLRRAGLLNNLVLFFLKQKEYSQAMIFAQKALALAEYLGEKSFLAKSSLVFLLAEIQFGGKNATARLRKSDIENLDRKSETQALLGKIYSLLHMHEDAKSACRNAIDLDRYNPAAHQGLGDIFLQEQNYEQAAEAYQAAIELQQNFPLAWVGLGKAYKGLGNHAKALDCYQSAIEINVFNAELWFEISDISAEKTSRLSIQRALQLEPENATYWNAQGNIQYHEKKYNDAIRSYYKAASIDKEFGWAYANMALIHAQADQPDKAVLLLTKSIQVFKNDFEKAHAYYRIGQIHQRQQKYTESAKAFGNAKKLFDNENMLSQHVASPGPLKFRAIVPKETGKQKSEFKKIKIRSAEPTENLSLQKILPTKEKVSYSQTLKKALKTNAEAQSIHYWLDLGDFYIRNRLYDLAEDTYRIAIELEPQNGWTYYNLGKAYMYTGLYDKAVPLYEKSIELFSRPKDKALCWNQLANAYRRLHQYSLALAAHESARLLEPKQNPMLARARASLLSNCQTH